ncbi:MAG TPA: hypothetical protein VFE88_00170 [Candidatus Nanoarchaeia archaeon]|nr:hypothetical protein [Candidatus Nanoarchaeia archaeon]
MPDQREETLNHLKLNGPALPVQIAKTLNTNILFASAVLAELVERKQVLITHLPIGGSKVYYLKGQESQMSEKMRSSLKGREKEAYELLRDNKVLRDTLLEPWQRVACRQLKDFAVPITVTLGPAAELFWKFHLLTDEEAKPHIEHHIEENPGSQPLTQQEQPQSTQQITVQEQPRPQPLELERAMQTLREELLKEIKPRLERKQAKKETKQETLIEPQPKIPEGKFYAIIKSYLHKNNIEIIKEEMIKKDKEFDFLARIPSSLGGLLYYIKAKDKKAINEADLSLAHSEAQLKKLPCILLVTGKPTKKATTLLEQKLQGQVHYKEL